MQVVVEKFKGNTVKGSQFRKPLLEFSGACAGCGETAQFAAAGKDVKKKDLAGIAMSYGYVYVAQIAMVRT
jgi:pyruvate/2-oxoacid:ferredoxin oxidoreductase beta subunit